MLNRKHSFRFSLVFLSFIFCLFVFAVKLVLIQIYKSKHLADLANKQHNHFIELEPIRGQVLDRNLRPLALNVSVYSLFANPRAMTNEDKQKAAHLLPSILNVDSEAIEDKLSRKKYFVWLKRKLSLSTVEEIKKLKIKGLDFISETKRFYPNGELASHIIGFAGIDNEGLEGIELAYNKELKGQPGWSQYLRDARQRELLIEKKYIAPKDGYNLVLTIDETIQYIAEQALEKAFVKHHAKSAMILVIDVRTGEVLALANRPTYNLEKAAQFDVANRTNRIVSFVYEPGSIFKIVTAAAALEEGAFVETDKIFCENGSYKIANHILHDHHPNGTLTFRQVFEKSSNIGVAKIAQKLGPDVIYKYGKKFRFGEKTNINLKGEVVGVFKEPRAWSKVSIGAIPIGHEVTATPLQLVYAMASIANDGVYMKPYIVKSIVDNHDQIIRSFHPTIVDRVISEQTARRVREILIGAVETGTGTNAKIKGVKVAGKTGTAQKVIGNQYSHEKYYASFVGFAPADDPKIAAIVILDEPYPSYFGGTVSAPVFREVVENTLKYLETSKTTGLAYKF